MHQTYAENVLFSIAKPEGPNTLTFDMDEVSGLFDICVAAVQATNEELGNPLYKRLLAGHLAKKEPEQEPDSDEEEEEDEEKDESDDGSNDHRYDRDESDKDDEGKKDDAGHGEDSEDDNNDPPPEKVVRKEQRIKRRQDKSGHSSSGKQQDDRQESPSLKEALRENFEHQQLLAIAEKVKDGHEIRKWKMLAVKQIANKWLLISRLKKYTQNFKTKVLLHAGRDQPEVTAIPAYPTMGTSQLVLAPSVSRIKQVLPEAVGTLVTRAWIEKVQQEAVKGPHLKIGLLYYEYLLRIQRDYEDMKSRYENIRRQEFLKAPTVADNVQYQLELLAEQTNNLVMQWPKYNMHDAKTCSLPVHPCTVQVLDYPPDLKILEADMGNSPMIRRLSSASTRQIEIPLEVMLGQRPRWQCLEEMKQEVRGLQVKFAEMRQAISDSISEERMPTKSDVVEHLSYLKFLIPKLGEYKQAMQREVEFVLQYLLSIPETPVCLYGIMPDEDSLPHFFPAIYPYMQEPRDAEEYVLICDKIKAWRLVYINNCQFMHQLIDNLEAEAAKGAVTETMLKESLDSIRATFEQWGQHQKKLIGHCNELLQTSILASRIIVKTRKTAVTIERDIAEQLMESRIHHKAMLSDGWIATAEYCLELAKCRFNEGSQTVYSQQSKSEVTLTLQEHDILVRNRLATLAKARKKMPAPFVASSSGEAGKD